MPNTYRYSVTWSLEDEVYVARVAEFPSLAAHGDTQDEALAAIRSVVATVVEELGTSGQGEP
jgi:predicted RNase H-like HicB family nuclease